MDVSCPSSAHIVALYNFSKSLKSMLTESSFGYTECKDHVHLPHQLWKTELSRECTSISKLYVHSYDQQYMCKTYCDIFFRNNGFDLRRKTCEGLPVPAVVTRSFPIKKHPKASSFNSNKWGHCSKQPAQ